MGATKIKKENEILSSAIIEALQNKKAKDLLLVDLRNVSGAVADFFVICTATSSTHASSLASQTEKFVHTAINEKPYKIEGTQNSQWVLIDYVNVVVHIFLNDTREFYQLEALWSDGKFTHFNENE